MTISDTHEYYANRILVANCVRYILMLHPELPTVNTITEGRDLAGLPDDVRWTIERMRRCDNPSQYEELEVMDPLEPLDSELVSPMEEFWAR